MRQAPTPEYVRSWEQPASLSEDKWMRITARLGTAIITVEGQGPLKISTLLDEFKKMKGGDDPSQDFDLSTLELIKAKEIRTELLAHMGTAESKVWWSDSVEEASTSAPKLHMRSASFTLKNQLEEVEPEDEQPQEDGVQEDQSADGQDAVERQTQQEASNQTENCKTFDSGVPGASTKRQQQNATESGEHSHARCQERLRQNEDQIVHLEFELGERQNRISRFHQEILELKQEHKAVINEILIQALMQNREHNQIEG